jgi:hypothetical protein
MRTIVAFVFAGLLAVPAAAQDKFTIKIKKDAKGDVIKATESETETGKMKITVGGMEMPKDESKSHSCAYTEKILEKEPGKRASKLERTYTKAEMTKDGNKITPAFVGKTVLIERSGKAYKFTSGGKELTGDDATFLNEEFKDKSKDNDEEEALEKAMLPKEAIAVNGTWKPDIALFVKEMMKSEDTPLDIDAAKSTATGKLLKAYKQDGKQFGAVEIEMNMPLNSIPAGPNMKIVMEAGSNIKITFRFDGCIDGTSNSGKMDMVMEMKMVGTLKAGDAEVKVDGTMKKTGTKTQEEAK